MIKTLLKLKSSFLTNLPWKIAAFLMAFVLWFLILNVEDPVRTDSWPVLLELRNEDALATGSAEGIHLENIEQLRLQTVRFQVRGTSRQIDAMRNSLSAYIDLSTPGIIAAAQRGDPLPVYVQPEGWGSVEIQSFSPRTVTLTMDTITTVEMPVVPNLEGDIAYGFFLPPESVSVTPNVIPVTGPSSIVNRINRLEVAVNIDNAASAIHLEDLQVLALDAAGDPIISQHLRFENHADVELPIFRRGRIQVLQPQHLATSPEGFGVHSVDWNPQWLDVAGEEYAIANLAPIMLTPIPEGLIANNTTDFYEEYDIRFFLPHDVFLIDPSRHTITVDVFVEPFVEQEFTIPQEGIAVLGLPPGAEVLTEEITVRLRALRSIMATVSTVSPTAFVTAANLVEGYNEIPLVFALPARVSLVNNEEDITITIYYEAIEEESEEAIEESEEAVEVEDDNEEAGD